MPVTKQEVLDLETLWSVRDLAEHFQITEHGVREAAKRGAIPGCTKSMGRYVFDRDVAIAGWKPSRSSVVSAGPAFLPKLAEGSEEPLLSLLGEVLDPERWEQICDKAIEQAIAGDRHARNWISGYLLGKPITRVASQSVSTQRTEFSEKDRAAVVSALLEAAKTRNELPSKVKPDRESTNRRADQE